MILKTHRLILRPWCEEDAFEDLHMARTWCGYYDGNTKSRRVMDKLGFVYQRKTEGLEVSLLGEIRTGHSMLLTRKTWENHT